MYPKMPQPWHLVVHAILALAAMLSALPAISSPDRPASMRFCVPDTETPPWLLSDRDGLAPILLHEVAKRLGVTATIDKLPGRRCFLEVQRGDTDGTFGSYVPERGAYPMVMDKLDNSRRVAVLSYSLFALKGSNVAFDGKTIVGLSAPVGVPAASSIIDVLKPMNVPFDAGARMPEGILKMALAGRVGAVALLTQTGDKLMQLPEFAGKFDKLGTPMVTRPYYVLLSRKFVATYPAFSEQLWDTVALVRESAWFRKRVDESH